MQTGNLKDLMTIRSESFHSDARRLFTDALVRALGARHTHGSVKSALSHQIAYPRGLTPLFRLSLLTAVAPRRGGAYGTES